MKKTAISRGLYVEALRRLRVFGFIALSVVIIFTVAPIIFQLFGHYMSLAYHDGQTIPPSVINFSDVLIALPYAVGIVPPVMMLIAFSVFNKRASSDFYHALPYTRLCIFVSTVAAVLTWTLFICIVSAIVGFAGYISFPAVFTLTYDSLLDIIFSIFALMLMTTGATALGMGLTGTLLTNVCVTALIVFLPRFIITLVTTWIENDAGFLSFSSMSQSILSPGINLITGPIISYFFFSDYASYNENISADIYSTCLGLLYLGLALWVFIKRKSETATQPAPARFVQHIIRISIACVVGVIASFAFIEGELGIGVILSLITFTVYGAYELITTHSFKSCLKALPFFGVVILLCAGCGIFTKLVPYVASSYTPEPEKIESVKLINDERDEWFGKEAAELDIKDKKVIELVSKTLDGNMKHFRKNGYISAYSVSVVSVTDGLDHAYPETATAIEQTVAIKQGFYTVYRTLFFTPEDYTQMIFALESNEDYMNACMNVPDPAKNALDFGIYHIEQDHKRYEEIFECLKKEIKSLSFEQWYNAIHGAEATTEYQLYYHSDDFDPLFVNIPISSCVFPKTFDMLMDYENADRDERLREFESIIDKIKGEDTDNIFSCFIGVRVKMTDSQGVEHVYFSDNDMNYYNSASHCEMYEDLLTKAKKCEKEPSSKEYAYISYSCDTTEEFLNSELYLPLPDDFNPEDWGMGELNSHPEDYYKYAD